MLKLVCPPPQAKGVNKGQRARLAKLADKLEEIHVEWNSVQQNIDNAVMKAFLPQPLVESAQKAAAEVQACVADVQVVLTEGWVGDPKKVLARVAAAALQTFRTPRTSTTAPTSTKGSSPRSS